MTIGTPVSLGSGTATIGASTVSLTLGTAIVANDLVVVAIGWDNNPVGSVSSVTDGTNTYALAGTARGASAQGDVELWYKANATAVASGTITATLSGTIAAGRSGSMIAARVTGVDSTPLDKSANSTATTATPTVSTGTLSQANEIVFGADFLSTFPFSYTPSTSSAFTQIGSTVVTVDQLAFVYRTVSSTSSVTNAPTWGTGGNQAPQAIASFKASSTTNANITGVAGTGTIGTVSPSVAKALTGVAGTGVVGTVTATSSAISQNITGVIGTGAVGSLVSSVSAFLTGVTGIGQTGVLLPTDSPGIAGVAGTSAVGSLRGTVLVFPVGVFGTGLVGGVTTPTQAFITGVSGIGQAGEVYPIPPAPLNRSPLLIPSENGLPASLWLGSPNGNLH